MATQYPSNRPTQGYNSRPAQRPAARPTGSRPAGTARPAGSSARPAGARPSGSRPAQSAQTRRPAPQGSRPTGNRRPPQRKKKPQGRFYAFIALAVLLIIALVLIIAKPFGGSNDPQVVVTPTAVPATVENTGTEATTETASSASHADTLAAMLGDSDTEVQGLSAEDMAVVTDLSVNQSLPSEWMNVLLLGSDERKISESARTDSMIICSINMNTGEVKLTSVMRDLAVDFDDIGKYNGTYRINSANYFGGEKLAMKTINECFGMNIDKYVRVNFFGFQEVAAALGGVEMDITEAEMNEINKRIKEQHKFAVESGVDDSGLPKELLETYGENVHLDGRQTLAYARIRKLDSDYARADRQRKVLVALMGKLKGAGAADLAMLASSCMQHVQTNLTLDEILAVSLKVLNSGLDNVESFRLPINDSYVQERRKNQEMFYDCDWSKNASALYSFIYSN